MIRFLFVLGNFLVGPSVNHFCDVGIFIKDYLRKPATFPTRAVADEARLMRSKNAQLVSKESKGRFGRHLIIHRTSIVYECYNFRH